ncbi:hypothetical protein WSK_3584 [Novosphingobium sp. Rr 2-17]|nr:hypothetical protein WSK_3584 [Novosphingobium sp. Rr 2-17]
MVDCLMDAKCMGDCRSLERQLLNGDKRHHRHVYFRKCTSVVVSRL